MEPEPRSSEMLARLRAFYAPDPSEQFTRSLSRLVQDPLMPTTRSGKLRFNPILLLLLMLMLLAGATFALFSLVQS